MKVKGKRLQVSPQGIREVIVPEEGTVQMTALSVKAEPVGEPFGYPNIHKASIPNEEAKFRTQGLSRANERGEFDLGNAADLLKGGH